MPQLAPGLSSTPTSSGWYTGVFPKALPRVSSERTLCPPPARAAGSDIILVCIMAACTGSIAATPPSLPALGPVPVLVTVS